MLSPHEYLKRLDEAGVSQKDIAPKVGVNQSSISRLQSNSFKRPSWHVVERIQSLYQHVYIQKKPVDDFPNYEDFLKSNSETGG